LPPKKASHLSSFYQANSARSIHHARWHHINHTLCAICALFGQPSAIRQSPLPARSVTSSIALPLGPPLATSALWQQAVTPWTSTFGGTSNGHNWLLPVLLSI
jgi:hypothetical protein